MKTKPASGGKAWSDPDDAPKLSRSFFVRAEIKEGDRVIRPARPTRAAVLRLDPDVSEALRATGDDWRTKANEALRAAFARQAKSP
jgi:uncharacterized protein (DUF4415 family)